jgi:hypothetical protein
MVQLAPTFCFVSSFLSQLLLLLSERVLRASIAFCVSVSLSFSSDRKHMPKRCRTRKPAEHITIGETDRRQGGRGKRGQSLKKKQFTPTVFFFSRFFFFPILFSILHSRVKEEVNWITKRERERKTRINIIRDRSSFRMDLVSSQAVDVVVVAFYMR